MYVNFYSLNKKINSTKRPGDYNYRVNCNLLYPCDVLSPTIQISGHNSSEDFTSVNYCYIPDFDRYYWITGKKILNATMQEHTLQVDVLASYRSVISNYSGQLSRTSDSSKYNLNVIDNMLIPTTGLKSEITLSATGNNPFNNGSISFLYYGDGSGSHHDDGGGYINSKQEATSVISDIYAWGDFWQNWVAGETNPSLYIRDFRYIPLQLSSYEDEIEVAIGKVLATIDDAKIISNTTTGRIINVSRDIILSGYADYGDFRDYDEKFTTCVLESPFLGLIDINPKYLRYDKLTIQYKVDMATGDCIASIYAIKEGSGISIPIRSIAVNISTPIPAGATSTDTNTIKSIVGSATGSIANASSGNIMGMVSDQANMAYDLTMGMATGFHNVDCIGGSGSFADYYAYACNLHIYRQGSTSNATHERGKPSMGGSETPSFNHYNQYANPRLSIPNATLSEIQEVNSYLSSGFYYE